MSTTLTFEEGAEEFVIEAFGRTVNDDGYIVDPETGEVETSPEGEQLTVEHFAGIEKGSEIFLSDDFMSLVNHVDRR